MCRRADLLLQTALRAGLMAQRDLQRAHHSVSSFFGFVAEWQAAILWYSFLRESPESAKSSAYQTRFMVKPQAGAV